MKLTFAESLAAAGYCVIPLTGRRKGCIEPWGAWVREGPARCQAQLLTAKGLTGAAICPQPLDPDPLLIIDIDAYDATLAEVWAQLAQDGSASPPASAGVVRSASGGFHFYFRLPREVTPKQVPATADFGGGCKGEVRCSGHANAILVLPGSKVVNKAGRIGTYEAVQPFMPATLCEPPEGLMRRLLARPLAPPTKDKDTLPTECYHVLKFFSELRPAVPEGSINSTLAQIGEVLGRIAPQPLATDGIMQQVADAVIPCLASPPFDSADQGKLKEFRRAVASGWKTGRQNREKYTARDAYPTVTDVLAECRAVFGGEPWLLELRKSDGTVAELRLGLGGSAKRPDQAFAAAAIRSEAEILPALTRISAADPDSVVTCPLHIQAGWRKALEFHLASTREIAYLGTPPEEAFMSSLISYAVYACRRGRIWETRNKERVSNESSPFIYYPPNTEQASLIIPAAHDQEALCAGTGDVGKAQALVTKHASRVGLAGLGNRKALVFRLEVFADDDLRRSIGEAFEASLTPN